MLHRIFSLPYTFSRMELNFIKYLSSSNILQCVGIYQGSRWPSHSLYQDIWQQCEHFFVQVLINAYSVTVRDPCSPTIHISSRINSISPSHLTRSTNHNMFHPHIEIDDNEQNHGLPYLWCSPGIKCYMKES